MWLITGASSGFGWAIAEAVLAAGETVLAGVRSLTSVADLAEAYPDRCAVAALDLTDGARKDDVVQVALMV